MRTKGLSPKAVLAFFFPLIAGVVAVIAEWLTTGAFNTLELRTTVASFVLSACAGLGAYLGEPGDVVVVKGP